MTLTSFRIEIPDHRLALLRDRLRTTVWADEPSAGADDWLNRLLQRGWTKIEDATTSAR